MQTRQVALHHELCRELAAAELAAELQTQACARQLGSSAPADALTAVATHAQSTWAAYVAAAGQQELGLGIARELGKALATAKYAFVDRWRQPQRAFRATLTDLHRGVECARLLRELAFAIGKPRLVRWCDDMIPRRVELIDQAEQTLGWFAVLAPRRLRLASMLLAPEHLSLATHRPG